MKDMICKESVYQLKYLDKFSYVLKNNEDFLLTEYKVLQNYKGDCLLKCIKTLFNGKIQLYYITEKYKPLKDIASNIKPEAFMSVMNSLFESILEIKTNGFLSYNSIDISLDKIFVDENTYKVKLVYLPIDKRIFKDVKAFEYELKTKMIEIISKMDIVSSNSISDLVTRLSSEDATIENLYANTNKQIKYNGEIYRTDTANVLRKGLKIVSLDKQNKVVIMMSKNPFIIGKKVSEVDGVVTFNKLISRVHCKIINTGNTYKIVDLNSANGTYINNIRLTPEEAYTINNGDVIRLANSEFKIEIE